MFGLNLAPILIHMMLAGTASAAAAEAEPFPTAAVVDLSKELEVDESAVSSSPGSMAINDYASSNPLIRTMMVLQDGKVVAKYVREDVDENVPNDTRSVTKSWTSLIMGMLIDEGKIALNSTLGSIFTDEQTWEDVPDSEIRKEVTIEDFLTHKSGFNQGYDEGLEHNLAHPHSHPLLTPIGERGTWQYSQAYILSFVIFEVTGLTPRQYLDQNALPKLGIDNGDIEWTQTPAGIEDPYAKLSLTPTQMAKFGQLYLQGGKAGPSESSRVVSEGFVDKSWTVYDEVYFGGIDGRLMDMGMTREEVAETFDMTGHGFLWWSRSFSDNVWCADGSGGQHICVAPSLGRVVVQQTDDDLDAAMELMLNASASAMVDLLQDEFAMGDKVGEIALDDGLSFKGTDDSDMTKTSSAFAMPMTTTGGSTMFAIAMLVMLDVLY